MHFGQQNPKHQYYLNDQTLDETDREKDLDVIIDDKLTFHAPLPQLKKRANQILGLIKKSYNTRDARTITKLYKPMVRRHHMGSILAIGYQGIGVNPTESNKVGIFFEIDGL